MKRLPYFLSLITVFCFLCCKQQKVGEVVPMDSCSEMGPFVREAKDIDGTVLYDSTRRSYVIRVANAFDSADIGFTCNLPTEYKKESLKVRFSGSYYEYSKSVFGPVGYRYYYLTIESISK